MWIRLPLLAALACAALAQTPAFEVASVRISEPITPEMVRSGKLNIGVAIDATHVRISKLSLADLVRLAYQIKYYQYSGPAWMNEARYDIQASLPEGAKRAQVPAMLQTLLAERFHLELHREQRDLAVFALVAAKGGHRMTATVAPQTAASGQLRGGATVAGGAMVATGPGGDSRVTPGEGGNLHVEMAHTTMAALADMLNRYTERPVVNATGIEGTFDVEFDIAGEEARSAARAAGAAVPPRAGGDQAADPAGVSLFTSIQKLGLRLEARKTAVEVLVVDRAEKVPTGN